MGRRLYHPRWDTVGPPRIFVDPRHGAGLQRAAAQLDAIVDVLHAAAPVPVPVEVAMVTVPIVGPPAVARSRRNPDGSWTIIVRAAHPWVMKIALLHEWAHVRQGRPDKHHRAPWGRHYGDVYGSVARR